MWWRSLTVGTTSRIIASQRVVGHVSFRTGRWGPPERSFLFWKWLQVMRVRECFLVSSFLFYCGHLILRSRPHEKEKRKPKLKPSWSGSTLIEWSLQRLQERIKDQPLWPIIKLEPWPLSFTRIDHSLGVDSDTIQITIMLFEMRNRIPRILHRRIDGLYE